MPFKCGALGVELTKQCKHCWASAWTPRKLQRRLLMTAHIHTHTLRLLCVLSMRAWAAIASVSIHLNYLAVVVSLRSQHHPPSRAFERQRASTQNNNDANGVKVSRDISSLDDGERTRIYCERKKRAVGFLSTLAHARFIKQDNDLHWAPSSPPPPSHVISQVCGAPNASVSDDR